LWLAEVGLFLRFLRRNVLEISVPNVGERPTLFCVGLLRLDGIVMVRTGAVAQDSEHGPPDSVQHESDDNGQDQAE